MLKVISGSSNPMLSEDVCRYMSWEYTNLSTIKPTNILTSQFSDGESRVEINENMRGAHVFVIQSITNNDQLIELMLILDALKRCNVSEVTVILPYYPYARQDKKDRPRVPITAKLVADIIQIGNINRVVTIDLHANQIQGYFDCPVDNLYAMYTLMDHIPKAENRTVVSPDAGGMERAKSWASKLDCKMAFCYKHRESPNEIGEMKLIGGVNGCDCLLVDDLIDTAGTLCKSADLLKENGANSVYAFATHPVLSGNAVQKLTDSNIDTVFIANTIPLPKQVLANTKFNVIMIDELLAKVIHKIYNKQSVSKLFL